MTTLKDVAKNADVSTTTVSYVLNDTGSVSKQVKNRILATIKKLGYTPSRTAQAMRTGRSKSLGLILSDITNPFFPELAQKIEDAAYNQGFAIILVDCQNDLEKEEEGISILIRHGVDGVLWCPVSDAIPESISRLSAPLVVIDRPIEGFDIVQSNHHKGGIMLSEFVLKLGHRKIGLLLGPQSLSSQAQRKKGFIENAKNKLEILWEIEIPFSLDLQKKALKILDNSTASLIVAGNDIIAIGAIAYLNQIGKKIPEEVSVIGFDDIPWAHIVTPQLTTVKQPVSNIASEAVNLIMQKINEPTSAVRQILLDVSICERDSTRNFS